MTPNTLWAKVYHIAQKTPQFFCIISIAMVYCCAIKTLFRSVNYSTNLYSFLLNKNSLIPIRVLKYGRLINQVDLLCAFYN